MAYGLFITCLADTLAPRSARDGDGPRARRARGRVPPRADVLRPAPPQRRLRRRGARSRGVRRGLRRLRGDRRAVGVVCGARSGARPGARRRRPRRRLRGRGSSPSSSSSARVSRRRLPFAGSLAYHPTCHSLRLLRLGDAPLSLSRRSGRRAGRAAGRRGVLRLRRDVRRQERRRVDRDARREARQHPCDGADAVCACDASCLLHIGGGLRRRGSSVRALHLAEVLAA